MCVCVCLGYVGLGDDGDMAKSNGIECPAARKETQQSESVCLKAGRALKHTSSAQVVH